MTDYKKLSSEFMDMFASRFDVRGQTVNKGIRREDGKEEVNVEFMFEKITEEHWELHLKNELPVSGETADNCRKYNKTLPFCGLGLVPIRPGTLDCRWGCIDIDQYDLNHKKVIDDIQKLEVPMIVFRSKSGGAHVFLFTKEWVTAAAMIEKLRSIAKELGLPKNVEIFPKQDYVREDGFGSFLNMPYVNAEHTQRYAFDDKGNAVDASDLKALYDKKALTLKKFTDLKVKKNAITKEEEAFPKGPPCLNHLAKIGFSQGSRNNGLYNVGVYCKKAFDEGMWQTKMMEYNNKYFNPPLPYQEVDNLIKSVTQKTYKYKCKDAPIEEHCKARECSGCKFGVSDGSDFTIPHISDLKIVQTTPAVYYVAVEGKEIKLTLEEWLTPSKFSQQCYGQARVSFPVPKSLTVAKWMELVVTPLTADGKVTLIKGIYSLTPAYLLEQHLKDYVTEMSTGNKIEDVLNNVSYTEVNEDNEPVVTYFRMKCFDEYLVRSNWKHSKEETTALFVRLPNYISEKRKVIAGRKVSVVTIKPFKEEKVEGSKPDYNKSPF